MRDKLDSMPLLPRKEATEEELSSLDVELQLSNAQLFEA